MKKVLIIEDDASMANLLQSNLQTEGIGATYAQDGVEGLERITKEKPDLILLDILIPKKGGKEVLVEIRSHIETEKIPVIILTNVGDDMNTISDAIALDAPDYFVKVNTSIRTIVERVKERLEEV